MAEEGEEKKKRSFTHSPGHSTGNVCVRGKPSKVRIGDWGQGGRDGDGPIVEMGGERECEGESIKVASVRRGKESLCTV